MKVVIWQEEIYTIIKPKKDGKGDRHEYRDRLISTRDSEHFNLLYRKRWHVESFFSRFKRMFGESVFSRS